ncbi:type II toxin-antitoxin system VapC family toxin [Cylindrospermum sp. FACHB-282]|uniref:type II toxin-antitoxin system VapC family toxin n=1 Tax=Cylindrospermum sp. FACHB-282 TaxID=2692794 RepID=UPI0018F04BAA|nr:PIN domain-containing protein [Cylindrospermum sp. FACHB-282]
MRVYLDTSVYNRPFDDQTQAKVFLETQAVLIILQMVEDKDIELVSSPILEYENSRNSQILQQYSMNRYLKMATLTQPKTTTVQERAEKLEMDGIKALDALHVACAEMSKCDYFITCDKRLINRCQTLAIVKTVNPIDFILEVENEN